MEQTPLPGVGIRYDFATTGRRLGWVIHQDGRCDMIIYSEDDPDNRSESVMLQPHERAALVELRQRHQEKPILTRRTHHRVWRLGENEPD